MMSNSEEKTSSASHDRPTAASNHTPRDDSTVVICGKDFGVTRPQMIAVVLLSLFFFLTSSFYSIFAPFYPGVATNKGMSETQIGIIFGVFQFTLLVLSPIFGKYVSCLIFIYVFWDFRVIFIKFIVGCYWGTISIRWWNVFGSRI